MEPDEGEISERKQIMISNHKIQTALDARRFGLSKWWLILIWAIAAGVAGFVLLARPVEATELIMQLVGLNLMIDGGLNLWVVLYTVKEHKNFRFRN